MLKIFRKISSNPFITISLSFAFLLVSCKKDSIESIKSCNSNVENVKNYSGEDLFKGIFLLQGDAAHKIPLLADKVNSIKKNYKISPDAEKIQMEFSNRILFCIKKSDNNFFIEFKEQIESGNYFKIREALSNGGAIMFKTAMEDDSLSKIFNLGNQIIKNKEDLITVKNADINTKEGKEKINNIILKYNNTNKNNDRIFFAFAGVVSIAVVVYTAVAVINAAAFATVVAWVAVTAARETMFYNESNSTNSDMFIKQIGTAFYR